MPITVNVGIGTLKPRVLVVTSRLDVGGTERHLTRVLPALREQGIDVALYAMERGGALERDLEGDGVPIVGPRGHGMLHWLGTTLALARHLRRERPDIVHFFLPRPYVFGSFAAELAGHRRRIMSRRSLTVYQGAYPLLGGLERLLHRRTMGIVGNSNAVVDQLLGEVSKARKVALIHSGIALPERIATAERLRMRGALAIEDSTLVIATVANLVAYKGHRDLLEALGAIKDRLPPSWRLLVIGRDDGMRDALVQRAQALALAPHILWLGERRDVGALLGSSDIFVLPSHQEGLSNALLEAMAAQNAVVATDVGGNPDVVTHTATGLLVPVRDPPALAAAVLRLAADPALRRRLGQAARVCVSERFSLDGCVAQYLKLYRALAADDPLPIGDILAERALASTREPAAVAP